MVSITKIDKNDINKNLNSNIVIVIKKNICINHIVLYIFYWKLPNF